MIQVKNALTTHRTPRGRYPGGRKARSAGLFSAGTGMLACACTAMLALGTAAQADAPPFSLSPLPYAQDALAPFISARAMDFHYGKHHQGYVNNLNRMVTATPLAMKKLEAIVIETSGAPAQAGIFNNAAQVWNHTFFWQSMKPQGGGMPAGRLMEMIGKSFGGYDGFRKAFTEAAAAQFGSGWVWLVQEGDQLKVVKTSNADTPIAHGQTPLLTCDVWEHAYYLDYQNQRGTFVETFLDRLVNWDFAASNLK